jgi:(R,R)-butanediol dehydrogenase / meso-butanediol dehydrogenase / diacetyl reductase
MAEPLAVALHAVRRQAAPKGEPVLVVGCGPIGGLAALLLSRLHDGPLLVADRNAARAALVAGVTGAAVAELDAGSIRSALGEKAALRYALDATGSAGVLSTLLGLLAGGGSIALVGITHGSINLDPNTLVEREIALVGCHAFAGELPDAVAMLPDLSTYLLQLVDREICLDEVPSAYVRLLADDARGLKTVICMGEPPK